jgi:hypothetical protein
MHTQTCVSMHIYIYLHCIQQIIVCYITLKAFLRPNLRLCMRGKRRRLSVCFLCLFFFFGCEGSVAFFSSARGASQEGSVASSCMHTCVCILTYTCMQAASQEGSVAPYVFIFFCRSHRLPLQLPPSHESRGGVKMSRSKGGSHI